MGYCLSSSRSFPRIWFISPLLKNQCHPRSFGRLCFYFQGVHCVQNHFAFDRHAFSKVMAPKEGHPSKCKRLFKSCFEALEKMVYSVLHIWKCTPPNKALGWWHIMKWHHIVAWVTHVCRAANLILNIRLLVLTSYSEALAIASSKIVRKKEIVLW